MQREFKLSLIVPVYNRPDEVLELLQSLANQNDKDFELIVVEDGSSVPCEDICNQFKGEFPIQYFFKENTGPGLSRNYGMEKAVGDYCIFLDSDCVLPPQYIQEVRSFLMTNPVDAFGGPDAADKGFSHNQKAINYAMTSFFTTGGIRGASEKLEKFHPRSFNMGITKEVYEKTGGFPNIRYAYTKAAGEDLDFSIQILKAGFKTALIPKAFVYHKRRASVQQFARQVYNFGIARITISKIHPESLKLLHFAPAIFTIGSLGLIILSVMFSFWFMMPWALFLLLVFVDSWLKNKNYEVAYLSMTTSLIQLFAYGLGFMQAFFIQRILGRKMSFQTEV
jgi:glycosyltransferase involved in cell wall biosynthesis